MLRTTHNPWSWQERYGFVQANEVSGAHRVLYCAGQSSVADDGTPIHAGDMAGQLERTVDNLVTLLESADMSLADVVRLDIITTDLAAFNASIGPTAERLAAAGLRQATTLHEVRRLFHDELMVEMTATACAPNGA